jgi:hypothetical protein
MKPTDDVSQFPENGMSTPETKLTVKTTDGAYQPDSLLSFNNANREVFRITNDGRMICGEGLSTEEATQEAAKLLIQAFEQEIKKMVDARVAAIKKRHPSWCCQKCGDYTGWVGRFVFPFFHKCKEASK